MVRMLKEIMREVVWVAETREHGVSGTSDGITRLRKSTLNSQRFNALSDLSPTWSEARIPDAFLPSSSLASRESLIPNKLPGP